MRAVVSTEDGQQAEALMAEGKTAVQRGHYVAACRSFEEALAQLRAAGDGARTAIAAALEGLGECHLALGDYAGAGTRFQEALAFSKAVNGDGHPSIARNFNWLGRVAAFRGEHGTARSLFQRALFLGNGLTDDAKHLIVATSLSGLGHVAAKMAAYDEAHTYFAQALNIRRALLGDEHPDVIASISNLGALFHEMGDYQLARSYYEHVLTIRCRLLGESHVSVASTLRNFASLLNATGEYVLAIHYLEQAIAIYRQNPAENQIAIAKCLNSLGGAQHYLGKYALAKTSYEQALEIGCRDLGPEDTFVAGCLNNLGILARRAGENTAPTTYYRRALEIYHTAFGEHHPKVATTLGNLGAVYHTMGDLIRSKDRYQQALVINRQVLGEHHPDIALMLYNLANLSYEMGVYEEARILHEQALDIRRRTLGDAHPDVAASLHNIAALHRRLKNHAQARALYEQSLAIRRKTLDETHPDIAASLNDIGNISYVLGDHSAARSYFEQALAIWQAGLGDLHPDRCYALCGLANVAISEDEPDEAARYLEEALRVVIVATGDSHLFVIVYRLLSKLKMVEGSTDAAIFFGKQAVNAIQSQRGQLKDLDPELQRSFLATKEMAYRELAELLVESSRLGEAQQVLAMLKEEELFDLLRRDAASDPRLTFAQLTRLEAEWRRHGDAIGADIVRLTEEVAALRKLAERTTEEEARFAAAREELDAASRAFRSWLDDLRGELAASSSPDDHSAEINLSLLERLQGDLRALGPGVALLSYVVSEKRLSLILTGERLQVSREVELSATHLNRLVHEFRFALDQKLGDALILGQALWRHLIAPVAPLLQQMRIETLMIVPYGTLRYLPFGALHDGEAYLAERFATPVLTLAAQAGLRDAPSSDWQVAGFGVSREVPGYRQLRTVADELTAIVKTPPEESGIYPGVIRLDERFTEDSFADALATHQAVHVASHFVLNPAQGLNSHLLLGDGRTLTLDRLRDPRFDFHDVELVTLSACETAIGAEREDGREFEGFAALVQQRGAGAVIASLWPVADESTASFMANFYRARRAGQNKAAALRGAQLALLRGNFPHPYHWAPFILMGNWL